MIGIQISGKNDRISAELFVRSISNFLNLIKEVDSVVSERRRGSVRWEIAKLEMHSPAVVEFVGNSRIATMDYSRAIEESVLDGMEQLMERPEQPQFYSYSAMQRAQGIAGVVPRVNWVQVFGDSRRASIDTRLFSNVEYIIGSETKSLGSVRGSLDAIMVHSGHEFRVWSPKSKRPITCRFAKEMLPEVKRHLKQSVDVFGQVYRNQKGEPVLVEVDSFLPLEPAKMTPSVGEMCGLVPDLYGGRSLKNYLEELRNG